MANIILASHGELAKGMLHSASMIIGDLTKGVEVFCLYPGQNPQDYADQFRLKIENSRDAWIILADILGGSVHTALSQLTAFGDVTILSGMNLNLVLSVLPVSYTHLPSSKEALDTLILIGRSGCPCAWRCARS